MAAGVGGAVELLIVTESGDTGDDHDTTDGHSSSTSNVVALHPAGATQADEDIDLDDLVDAPPESVVTPIQRLAQAFPGAELIDERR